jgi:protein TonB
MIDLSTIDRHDALRWTLCGAVIVAAHLAAGAALMAWPRSGDAGSSVVAAIELAPELTAPPSPATDATAMAPLQPPQQEQKEVDTEEDQPDTPQPVTPLEKMPEPPIARSEIPLPTEQPKPPKPKPKQHAQHEVVASAPPPAPQVSDKLAAPTMGTNAQRQLAQKKWNELISAHLSAFKRYPEGASKSGSPEITFVVTQQGQLVSAALAKSSGVPALDQEALSIVRRANPFPRAPAGAIKGEFTVPLRFTPAR